MGLAGLACDASTVCEEDIRAQVLDEPIEILVGNQVVNAELADTPSARERGWKHRRCGREALVLVPDMPQSALAVWGCGLVEPVDLAFVADEMIVELARLEPCPEPCGSCTTVGEGLEVDFVLEVPVGSLELELGQAVVR